MTTRRQLIQSTSALALTAILPRCASVTETKPPRQRIAFADIPRSDYGFDTTADEVVANLDLTGKTALVTGCNSGLGYETLRTLVGAGAYVIGTVRTEEKGKALVKEAVEWLPNARGGFSTVVCELSDMASVANCATRVQEFLGSGSELTRESGPAFTLEKKIGPQLDILICNAGIMALPERELVEIQAGGQTLQLEKQFVVNHLGHYLLTRRLLPQVLAAPAGRIVMVSSGGYSLAPQGGIQFDNLDFAGTGKDTRYQPFKAYGQSKLANILMSNELDRRYFDAGLTSNAIGPGVVATNLGRYMSGKMRDPDKPLGKGQKWPDAGAATQVYVATDPRLENVSGHFFRDCNPEELKGPYANDAALAERLWQVSEELVGDYLGSDPKA